MARKGKEVADKSLPVQLADVKWLVQPIEVTMMKGELSPLEVNIIVEVIESLQENLKRQVEEKATGKQLTLFDFQDEPILIDLAKFGVLPCDYWRLDEAAKRLSDFKIFHRFKDERGNWVDGYSVIFPDAGISKSSVKKTDGSAYKYKGGSRAVGYMRITVNKTVAPYLLNINKEYTRYIKAATRGRKCMYTPRMVMFISSYRDRGKWIIEYDEFRRLIGLLYSDEVDVMDPDTKKTRKQLIEKEKKGYAKFSDVKRRIIDPARDEMKEMCEEKKLDCYFEYEPIFPAGKSRGLPDSLVFYIHKGPLGIEYDAKKVSNKENAELAKYLTKTFGLARTAVRTLMERVNDENRDGFRKKATEVATYIDKRGNVLDVAGYAYSSLVEYLNSLQVGDNGQTLDNNEAPENVCDLSQNVAQQATKDESLEAKWGRVMAGFRPLLTVQEWRQSFDYSNALRPLRFDEGSITLGVSDKHYYDDFMERFFERLKPFIYQEFGLVGIYFEQFK